MAWLMNVPVTNAAWPGVVVNVSPSTTTCDTFPFGRERPEPSRPKINPSSRYVFSTSLISSGDAFSSVVSVGGGSLSVAAWS